MSVGRVAGQATGKSVGSSASTTLAMPNNVTSGNVIVIGLITDEQTHANLSITYSAGTATIGTPVKHTAQVNGLNNGSTTLWSVPVTGSGSLTLSYQSTTNRFFTIGVN